ncbi:hypothetical protein ISS03_05205, partial [Patescibacteria group bacterium]|nr:hypothetical protein [Patescibacteria group bacterium]
GGTSDDLLLYQVGANNISLYTNGTEQMRITSGGNVGIGTTGPNAKLHVRGAVNEAALIIDPDESVNNGSTGILFGASNSSANKKAGIFFQRDGLDGSLRGDLIFANNNTGNGDNASTTDAVMVLQAGGNVGIGTTEPGSKLSVVGLPSGSTRSAAGVSGNLAGAVCITDTGNMYIDTDGSCAGN